MPTVSVQCPHCSHSYSVDGSLVGRKARCKNCGNSFALAPSGELAGPSPAPSADPASGPHLRAALSTTPTPEKIGRFLIKERLGAGAFGAVYRALDPTLDRDVALKVPHRELQQDPKSLERFLVEAKAAARLQHPHIVPVYETGTDGDSSYIASAFIRGRSLADAIEGGPFEPRRAARIVAALADALHAAHKQGIVHRDVKPANVLLDDEGRPHLTDFGLARLASARGRLTQVNAIVGTPAYLAPEQARGQSDRADAASDQYSLGVTLYELLCGEVPFAGPMEVVIFHTLQTPPPPLRAEHPDVPAELETICLKTLSKEPGERYSSCRELATELGKWLAGRPITRHVPTQPATELLEVPAPANAPGPMALGASSMPLTVVDQNLQGDTRSLAVAEPMERSGRRLPSPPWTFAATVGAVIVPLLAAVIYLSTRRNQAPIERNDSPAPLGLAPKAVVTTTPLASSAKTSESSTPPAAAALTQPAPPVATVTGAALTTANSATPPVASKPDVRPEPISSAADRSEKRVRASSPNERQPSRSLAYHEQMAEVQRALAAKDVAAASQVLASCPGDLRGWEWHYCQRLCALNAGRSVASGSGPGIGGPAFVTEQVLTINQPPRPLTNVAFSPDGTRVATTGGRRSLAICDAAEGVKLESKDMFRTFGLAYSPDGNRIATGGSDGFIRIWNVKTLTTTRSRPVHVLGRRAGIYSVAFSYDGRSVASAGYDGTLRIWDFADEIEVSGDTALGNHSSTSGSDPREFRGQAETKIDSTGRSKVRTFGREQGEVVCDVVWDPEGRWIAGGGAGKIKFWDLKSGEQMSTIDFLAGCLALSPDGRRIAAASMDPDPRAKVWDVETGKTVMTLTGKKAIAFIDFSPDGKRLATAGQWNVQIWDATTGHQLLELGEPRDDNPQVNVFSMGVRFSHDGRRIASVRGDLLRIWSIADAPSGAAPTPTAEVSTAILKPSGPEIVTTRIGSIKLTRIPTGTFLMGSPKSQTDAQAHERPLHEIRISRPFYLGIYEVTQVQYHTVTGQSPSWISSTGGGKELVTGQSTDQHPVESVSWLEAVTFCNALSTLEGLKPFYIVDRGTASVPDWRGTGFRLPTEAEWEYACRAGTQTRYYFGERVSKHEDWADKAWIADTSGRNLFVTAGLWQKVNADWLKYREELRLQGCRSHPVGEKRPNGYGLHDMLGNVCEWCWDWYDKDYYRRTRAVDPNGPESGTARIARSVSWQSEPWMARPAQRSPRNPSERSEAIGIRVARTCP